MVCLKLGEKRLQVESKEWIKLFKIALIEKDAKSLQNLQNALPLFSKLDELKTAQALISQAIALFQQRRDKTLQDMNELKKVISFHKLQNNKNFNSFNQYS